MYYYADNIETELDWYDAMKVDPRDCVRVCDDAGRELVPFDALSNALKCCRHARHNAQWKTICYSYVRRVDVVQDVRGYMRVTLYI